MVSYHRYYSNLLIYCILPFANYHSHLCRSSSSIIVGIIPRNCALLFKASAPSLIFLIYQNVDCNRSTISPYPIPHNHPTLPSYMLNNSTKLSYIFTCMYNVSIGKEEDVHISNKPKRTTLLFISSCYYQPSLHPIIPLLLLYIPSHLLFIM